MSKLGKWQERLKRGKAAYDLELQKMAERELIYAGRRKIRPTTDNDKKDGEYRETAHVWNVVAENIEAMIDSSIPMPKVTPMRKEDEAQARMIENMLRNEIDRLPMERINDTCERTAKKQGGVFLLVEWDETKRRHTSVGENSVKAMHPQRVIPQDGVQELEDMDWIIVRCPMTKSEVQSRWGVNVNHESEADSELRDGKTAEDIVTVEMGYYKNGSGGIGRYCWVNDIEVEDTEDIRARRQRRCKKCGQTEVDNLMVLDEPVRPDGKYPEGAKTRKPRKDQCAYCGSRSWETTEEWTRMVPLADLVAKGAPESVINELTMTAGTEQTMEMPQEMSRLQALSGEMIATAAGLNEISVEIPNYQPKGWPMILMRNITGHNKFLGESDVDAIEDQQNTLNRMEQKMLDKVIKAGSFITAPAEAAIMFDAEDRRIIRVPASADLALIKEFNFDGDISTEMAYINQVYAEAQKRVGVTESFLGRRDATATSGTAKEFAAAQTAGRLESKRVLKKLAWSQVYEAMFQNMLAYADEARPIYLTDENGEASYEEWNRWAFLKIDAAGQIYWNDEFLFSCDDASGLAANREAMWKETTAHLQSGAYGNPQEPETLIRYWAAMEELHYPGAGKTKKQIEEQAEQRAAQMVQQQQQQMQSVGAMPQMGDTNMMAIPEQNMGAAPQMGGMM